MRFVHIADMHFDSPFTLLSNQENFGDQRRLDQRKALKKNNRENKTRKYTIFIYCWRFI